MSLSFDNYFDVDKPTFWRLTVDAVEWNPLGTTLVVREEVIATLEALKATGIPDAEALMLYFALFGDGWKVTEAYAKNALDVAYLRENIFHDWEDRYRHLVSSYHALAESCRDLPHWKISLAQIVFERADRSDLRTLDESLDDSSLFWRQTVNAANPGLANRRFAQAMKAVLAGPLFVSREMIEARRKAGVGAVPPPVPVEPEEEGFGSLLGRLREDCEDTRLIAGMTERLLPVFTMQGPMRRPQDLPLGGYSDLSSRGSLDRLLPSELAHDDDTLVVRIAMGEAMYLRREAPQVQEQPTRLVLLDDGVRSWGIQRYFLFAAMLALLAERSDKLPHESFRLAREKDLKRIHWDDPKRILEEVGNLSGHAHVGEGLAELVERAERNGGQSELYVLSTTAAARDPLFQLALRKLPGPCSLSVIAVERNGSFEITRHSAGGSKVTQRLQIDPEEILSAMGEVPRKREEGSSEAGQLPDFYRHYPFPLLSSMRLPRVFPIADQCFLGRSGEGDLFLWDHRSRNPRALARRPVMGRPKIRFAHRTARRVLVVLEGSESLELLGIEQRQGKVSRLDLRFPDTGLWKPERYWVDAGVLYLLGPKRVESYDLNGGLLAACAVPPDWICAGANFYRDNLGKGFQVVYATGSLHKEALPSDQENPPLVPDLDEIDLPREFATKRQHIRNLKSVVIRKSFLQDTFGLVTQRGRLFELVLGELDVLLRDTGDTFSADEEDVIVELQDVPGEPTLRSGTWGDGSSVWVDRRGFLHLCSAHNGGQLSLTLRQGMSSVWHSTQGFSGGVEDNGSRKRENHGVQVASFFSQLRDSIRLSKGAKL